MLLKKDNLEIHTTDSKVPTFSEGHKIYVINLPIFLRYYKVMSKESRWLVQIFVAFSKYLNAINAIKATKRHEHLGTGDKV